MECMVRPSSLSVGVTFHKERIKAAFQLHLLLKGSICYMQKEILWNFGGTWAPVDSNKYSKWKCAHACVCTCGCVCSSGETTNKRERAKIKCFICIRHVYADGCRQMWSPLQGMLAWAQSCRKMAWWFPDQNWFPFDQLRVYQMSVLVWAHPCRHAQTYLQTFKMSLEEKGAFPVRN